MTDFSNNTIDTLELPRYEDAQLTSIHPLYMKVVWVNLGVTFGIIALAAAALFYFIHELAAYWLYATVVYAVLLLLAMVIQVVNYKNKGYAFREHDVIYRTGAISVTTTVIPYNRIQHVAEHEGIVSRWLGLSSIGIFTAGGTGSDVLIPGLEKEHALAVKQLLVDKIDKDVHAYTGDNMGVNTVEHPVIPTEQNPDADEA